MSSSSFEDDEQALLDSKITEQLTNLTVKFDSMKNEELKKFKENMMKSKTRIVALINSEWIFISQETAIKKGMISPTPPSIILYTKHPISKKQYCSITKELLEEK